MRSVEKLSPRPSLSENKRNAFFRISLLLLLKSVESASFVNAIVMDDYGLLDWRCSPHLSGNIAAASAATVSAIIVIRYMRCACNNK